MVFGMTMATAAEEIACLFVRSHKFHRRKLFEREICKHLFKCLLIGNQIANLALPIFFFPFLIHFFEPFFQVFPFSPESLLPGFHIPFEVAYFHQAISEAVDPVRLLRPHVPALLESMHRLFLVPKVRL
jgi:hypothetical protein